MRCRALSGHVSDKTEKRNEINIIRPRANGRDRKTEAQQKKHPRQPQQYE